MVCKCSGGLQVPAHQRAGWNSSASSGCCPGPLLCWGGQVRVGKLHLTFALVRPGSFKVLPQRLKVDVMLIMREDLWTIDSSY